MTKPRDIMILTAMLMLIVAQTTPAANPRVRIRAAASIDHTVVRLVDIADVVTDDVAVKMQLESVVVANMPPGQVEMSLDFSQINKALNAAGIISPSVDVYGFSRCLLGFEVPQPQATVTPVAIEEILTSIVDSVPRYTLSDQLNNTVAQLLGRNSSSFLADWRCRQNPQLLQEDAENGRFQIKPRSSVHLLGRTYFNVVDTAEPGTDEVPPQVFRIEGYVQYLCESVITTTALPSGHVVTADDIKLLPHRVTSFRDVGITDENLVLGRKLVRGVAANERISHSMLRRVELIKRNDIVKVSTIVNRIKVTMNGIAQASAALGDSILVSYGADTDPVRGRVIGPGSVTVDDMRLAAASASNNNMQTIRGKN